MLALYIGLAMMGEVVDLDAATNEFRHSLARVLCEWKVNLVLNFLPDEYQ